MSRLFRITGSEITPEFLSEYSNDTRIRKFEKPVLVIHGTNDFIIPSSQGQLIYESLPESVEKKLVLIEGAGHNDIFSYEDEYLMPLKEFINFHK